MLIRNPQTFRTGVLLAVSFSVVLFLIFMPIFGGVNGLVYSDDLFNKLSKGSSNFFDEVNKAVKKTDGKTFSVTIKADKPGFADKAVKTLLKGGAQVGATGDQVTVGGDLGKVLGRVVADAQVMYNNNGKTIESDYGMNEREVMETWWAVLTGVQKELIKNKQIDEANVINMVLKKAIEPAYNFYGIEAQNIVDKALTVIALLVFYVIYTMWWGYAIFYMFDGLGLSMKKAKVKKEV